MNANRLDHQGRNDGVNRDDFATDNARNIADILGIVPIGDIKEPNESDKWLIPNVVTTTNTLIFGQASAGKSMAVTAMVASVVDGRDFLGIKPVKSDIKVLLVCVDRNAELEYKERLTNLGVGSNVWVLPGAGSPDAMTWYMIQSFAKDMGIGLVVIDHATGVIVGDEKERLPWVDFYQNAVEPFNLPVIVVAHSSDSTYQGQVSHRPLGNSAATQFTRCEVEIYRPGNNKFKDNAVRVLRTSSRYGDGIEQRFRIVEPGVMVLDAVVEATDPSRDRSRETMDSKKEIARLAVESGATKVADAAKYIASKTAHNATTLEKRVLKQLVDNGLLTKERGTAYSFGDRYKG